MESSLTRFTKAPALSINADICTRRVIPVAYTTPDSSLQTTSQEQLPTFAVASTFSLYTDKDDETKGLVMQMLQATKELRYRTSEILFIESQIASSRRRYEADRGSIGLRGNTALRAVPRALPVNSYYSAHPILYSRITPHEMSRGAILADIKLQAMLYYRRIDFKRECSNSLTNKIALLNSGNFKISAMCNRDSPVIIKMFGPGSQRFAMLPRHMQVGGGRRGESGGSISRDGFKIDANYEFYTEEFFNTLLHMYLVHYEHSQLSIFDVSATFLTMILEISRYILHMTSKLGLSPLNILSSLTDGDNTKFSNMTFYNMIGTLVSSASLASKPAAPPPYAAEGTPRTGTPLSFAHTTNVLIKPESNAGNTLDSPETNAPASDVSSSSSDNTLNRQLADFVYALSDTVDPSVLTAIVKYVMTISQNRYNQYEANVGFESEFYNNIHMNYPKTLKSQPSLLRECTLKPYQMDGLRFLVSLYLEETAPSSSGTRGALLSDDMGLGKTLQTISLFSYLAENRISQGMHLVVAPLAVSDGWAIEFRKWCPHFNVCIFKGDSEYRKELRRQLLRSSKNLDIGGLFGRSAAKGHAGAYSGKGEAGLGGAGDDAAYAPVGPAAGSLKAKSIHTNYNVVVTTYEYIIKERALFKSLDFDCLVIDEASRIKNSKSVLLGVLKKDISCRFRLLLSGTPVQNNIRELYTLLSYIHSEVYNDYDRFERIFGKAIANGSSILGSRVNSSLSFSTLTGGADQARAMFRPVSMSDMTATSILTTGNGGPQPGESCGSLLLKSSRREGNSPVVIDDAQPRSSPHGAVFASETSTADNEADTLNSASFSEVSNETSVTVQQQCKGTLTDTQRVFVIERLHGLLKPFLLRRVKADVLDQLPSKDEIILRCSLSGMQYFLYNLAIQEGKRILGTYVDTQAIANANANSLPKSFIRNIDIYLRSICNHPYISLDHEKLVLLYKYYCLKGAEFERRHVAENTEFFRAFLAAQRRGNPSGMHALLADGHGAQGRQGAQGAQHTQQAQPTQGAGAGAGADDAEAAELSALTPLQSMYIGDQIFRVSGKLQLLDNILHKMKATDHRILIFSQFKRVLDMLSEYMEYRNYRYLRFDGSVKDEDRSRMIRLFNADDSPVFCFLLSTRAASHGLNLQTADTVIIYDADFNATYDLQAQDRCYRMGQKRAVKVFKMYTNTTMEQKMLDIALSKTGLSSMLIDAGGYSTSGTAAPANDTEESQQSRASGDGAAKDARKSHRDYILEILNAKSFINNDVGMPTPAQLNRLISRSDNEYRLFAQMDEAKGAEWARRNFGEEVDALDTTVPEIFHNNSEGLLDELNRIEIQEEDDIAEEKPRRRRAASMATAGKGAAEPKAWHGKRAGTGAVAGADAGADADTQEFSCMSDGGADKSDSPKGHGFRGERADPKKALAKMLVEAFASLDDRGVRCYVELLVYSRAHLYVEIPHKTMKAYVDKRGVGTAAGAAGAGAAVASMLSAIAQNSASKNTIRMLYPLSTKLDLCQLLLEGRYAAVFPDRGSCCHKELNEMLVSVLQREVGEGSAACTVQGTLLFGPDMLLPESRIAAIAELLGSYATERFAAIYKDIPEALMEKVWSVEGAGVLSYTPVYLCHKKCHEQGTAPCEPPALKFYLNRRKLALTSLFCPEACTVDEESGTAYPSAAHINFHMRLLLVMSAVLSIADGRIDFINDTDRNTMPDAVSIPYYESSPFWILPLNAYLPSYYELIKHPVPLQLIWFKIVTLSYSSLFEFYRDFRQALKNCFAFNERASVVYISGKKICAAVTDMVRNLFSDLLSVEQLEKYFSNYERRTNSVKNGFVLLPEHCGHGIREIARQKEGVDDSASRLPLFFRNMEQALNTAFPTVSYLSHPPDNALIQTFGAGPFGGDIYDHYIDGYWNYYNYLLKNTEE